MNSSNRKPCLTQRPRLYGLAELLVLLLSLCTSSVWAAYAIDKTSTTSGNSYWGSSILAMTASLSGSNITFTVSKNGGGSFSSSGTMYLKVGTYESYGANRDSKNVTANSTTSLSFTHDLNAYSGYPKDFYARYEGPNSTWAWGGPIKVSSLAAPKPAIPNAPTASATGTNSINISWSAVSNAAIYGLWRADSATGTYKQIYCAANSSYTDSGTHLLPATTYYYKVKAGNSEASCSDGASGGTTGWSDFSGVGSATTQAKVPTGPSVEWTKPVDNSQQYGLMVPVEAVVKNDLGIQEVFILMKDKTGNLKKEDRVFYLWHAGTLSTEIMTTVNPMSTGFTEKSAVTVSFKVTDKNGQKIEIPSSRTFSWCEKNPCADTELPTGSISGINNTYTVGETVSYQVQGQDNEALSKLSFSVADANNVQRYNRSWDVVSGTSANYSDSLSTAGWGAGTYYYALWVKDKTGNAKDYTGSISLSAQVTNNDEFNIELNPETITCGIYDVDTDKPIEETCEVNLTNKSRKEVMIQKIELTGEDAGVYKIIAVEDKEPPTEAFPLPPYSNAVIKLRLNPQGKLPMNGNIYKASLVVNATMEKEIIATTRASRDSTSRSIETKTILESTCQSESQLSQASISSLKVFDALSPIKERQGFVADGNARLILRATTVGTASDIVFKLPKESTSQLYRSNADFSNDSSQGKPQLQTSVVFTDSDKKIGQATAILRAPERFPGKDDQEEVSLTVQACFAYDLTTCIDKVLKIRRAPVILIHGIWGSADSFINEDDATNDMKTRLQKAHFKVDTFEYPKAQGPSLVMQKTESNLESKIRGVCRTVTDNFQLACTRADIVAHSMGGLVTRIYAKENVNFLSEGSFRKGNIRRLVTLGTPHTGSELANLLWWFQGGSHDRELVNNCVVKEVTLPSLEPTTGEGSIVLLKPSLIYESGEWWLQQLINLMNCSKSVISFFNPDTKVDYRINQGGVDDLRVDGTFMRKLNSKSNDETRKLSTRAIVGDTGEVLPYEDKSLKVGTTKINTKYFMEKYIGCSHDDLFHGSNSDSVVPTYSATGERVPGVRGGFNPTTLKNSPHLGMGTNPAMIGSVIDNLNGPLSNFVKH